MGKKTTILTFLKFMTIGLLLVFSVYGVSLYFINAEAKISTILVSAASSLKPVLEEITPIYEQANPKVKITYNFGASGSLEQQLEQGATADVFIAASAEHIEILHLQNLLIYDTKKIIAANRLALVVPTSSHFNDLTRLTIDDFIDLTKDEVQQVTIGDPRTVAAGKYAQEVLEKSGIWQKIQPKLALAQDARAILVAVEKNDTDAGIMYLTDARTSDLVTVVKISPTDLHSPIIYPAVVLKSSRQQRIARSYIDFLGSKLVQDILEKYSFKVS
jgi:molybdate transport system substrate-binding protein